MLKKKKSMPLLLLFVLLLVTSCVNSNQKWHTDQLVIQLYRQYKQELILSYNDFSSDIEKNESYLGYAKAYFDNYKREIIFTKQNGLEYLVKDKIVKTSNDEIDGYIANVLTNENYQIGIEILNVKVEDMNIDNFDGAKTRIKNLNSQKEVIFEGLLFNECLLNGEYLYGLLYDNDENEILEIVNVETMEHSRIDTSLIDIDFIYKEDNRVFAQSQKTNSVYQLTENDVVKQKKQYNKMLPSFGNGAEILKDIAPISVNEHWYVVPEENTENISKVQFLRILDNSTLITEIELSMGNIVQIMDCSNYGTDEIAIFYVVNNDENELLAILDVYDLDGQHLYSKDVTELRDGYDRFTFVDYTN